MKDNRKKEYATSDLYLAAFLKCAGLKLLRTERGGRKAVFIFRDIPQRRNLVLKFVNDTAVCKVKKYRTALRDLKSFAFDLER